MLYAKDNDFNDLYIYAFSPRTVLIASQSKFANLQYDKSKLSIVSSYPNFLNSTPHAFIERELTFANDNVLRELKCSVFISNNITNGFMQLSFKTKPFKLSS